PGNNRLPIQGPTHGQALWAPFPPRPDPLGGGPPRAELPPTGPSPVQQGENKEDDHRPEDGQEPAVPGILGKRERVPGLALEDPVDGTAYESAHDAQNNGHQQAQPVAAGDQQAGDQPYNQAAQGPAQDSTYHVNCPPLCRGD